MAALIKEGGIVLVDAVKVHVPFVVHIVRLEIAFSVRGRGIRARNGKSTDCRDRGESNGGYGEKVEHGD